MPRVVLALSLALAGLQGGIAVGQPCPMPRAGAPSAAHAEHADTEHAHHAGHADSRQHTHDRAPSPGKSCLDCCGVCIATAALAAPPPVRADRITSARSDPRDAPVLAGQDIPVDPGIPKHMA